jgi:hypothetical protein
MNEEILIEMSDEEALEMIALFEEIEFGKRDIGFPG